MEHSEYTEKQESPLSPDSVREQLEEDVKIEDLPAISILEEQMNNLHSSFLEIPAYNHYTPDLLMGITMAEFLREMPDDKVGGAYMYDRVINCLRRIDNPVAFDGDIERLGLGSSILGSISEAAKKIKDERGDKVNIEDKDGWKWVYGGPNAMRQSFYPDQEIKYRVYLSPAPEHIGSMLEKIATSVPEQTDYYMKTFGQFSEEYHLSRGDKIICYCTEDNFDTILNTLSDVIEEDPKMLENRPSPGGGKISPLPGISISKQAENYITGSQEVAKLIEQTLIKRSRSFLREKIQEDYDIQIKLENLFIGRVEKGGKKLENIEAIREKFFNDINPTPSKPSSEEITIDRDTQRLLDKIYLEIALHKIAIKEVWNKKKPGNSLKKLLTYKSLMN